MQCTDWGTRHRNKIKSEVKKEEAGVKNYSTFLLQIHFYEDIQSEFRSHAPRKW